MGKRKETPVPTINGEAETRKSLRTHGRRPNYQEISSDSDSDNSRGVHLRLTRASETEMVGSDRNLIGENSSADLIARGTQGPGEGVSAATCTSNAAETATSGPGRKQGRRGASNSGCGAEQEVVIRRWVNKGMRSGIPQRGEVEEIDRRSSPNEGQQPSNTIRGPPPPEQMGLSCKKTVLSWLINHKLVGEGEEVHYYDGRKRRAGGVTRGVIICGCCQREFSVWDFEKHVGSDLRKPYKYIQLHRKGTHTPLKHYQITAWQNPIESKRRTMFSYVPIENAAHRKDDACSICGVGGDLICCEKCPSTYHPSCINMESVPHTNWFCPYCICKFCGLGGEYKEFITCCQCDKKFHWLCFKESEEDFSRETLDPSCLRLYCGLNCRKIYEKLETSLRVGPIQDDAASYSWRVVSPMDMISTPLVSEDSCIENNSKVAVAGMLMSEAFDSITDRCTGIDIVQSVVYSRGSNLNRINFSRFNTFILEKNDEMIAAASVRIHGKDIAEMPFIATVESYRGKGICQILMKTIESFLCDLNVENLIIPSTAETVEMWKRKYSFDVVNNELKRKISLYNTLMFPLAVRLCKDLKGIADSGRGDENECCQTDSASVPLSQLAQVEVRATFDNDTGNTQLVVERLTQTSTQNSPEVEPVQAAQADRGVKFTWDLNNDLEADQQEEVEVGVDQQEEADQQG